MDLSALQRWAAYETRLHIRYSSSFFSRVVIVVHSINFQMSHIQRLKRPLTFSRSLQLLFSSSGDAAALLRFHPHFPYQVAFEWEFIEAGIYSVHNSNYMKGLKRLREDSLGTVAGASS